MEVVPRSTYPGNIKEPHLVRELKHTGERDGRAGRGQAVLVLKAKMKRLFDVGGKWLKTSDLMIRVDQFIHLINMLFLPQERPFRQRKTEIKIN